jgi:hypothetical protein
MRYKTIIVTIGLAHDLGSARAKYPPSEDHTLTLKYLQSDDEQGAEERRDTLFRRAHALDRLTFCRAGRGLHRRTG